MAPKDDPPRTRGAEHIDASGGEAETGSGQAPPAGASDVPSGEPHDLRLVVWDTPPAVERGKPFAIKLGLSCPTGCRPAGWAVEVRDHRGERLATATLGDAPWPGTDALYHAECALVAPDTEGLHAWEATTVTDGLADTHTGGSARFGVRVVAAPACALTVVATDAESRTPIEGARVVAHPYRAVTDERGAATLQVPAGQYRLFVSGKGYAPFRFDGEVKTDTTIRAALVQDVELSDADIWS